MLIYYYIDFRSFMNRNNSILSKLIINFLIIVNKKLNLLFYTKKVEHDLERLENP